jgi:DNA-binding XRE family transcriptional regulator
MGLDDVCGADVTIQVLVCQQKSGSALNYRVTERQITKVVGANVRKARLAANMTQECLAELIGIEWKSISYLENGRHSLLLTKIARIIQVLGVSPNQLFDGLPEPDYKQIEKIKKTLARKRKPKSA